MALCLTVRHRRPAGPNSGVLRFDDLLDSGMESLSGELERRQEQVNCDDHCSIQFTSVSGL